MSNDIAEWLEELDQYAKAFVEDHFGLDALLRLRAVARLGYVAAMWSGTMR